MNSFLSSVPYSSGSVPERKAFRKLGGRVVAPWYRDGSLAGACIARHSPAWLSIPVVVGQDDTVEQLPSRVKLCRQESDTTKKMQRPRHVLVSDDEDETMAKRSFSASQGSLLRRSERRAGSQSCGFPVSASYYTIDIQAQHGQVP